MYQAILAVLFLGILVLALRVWRQQCRRKHIFVMYSVKPAHSIMFMLPYDLSLGAHGCVYQSYAKTLRWARDLEQAMHEDKVVVRIKVPRHLVNELMCARDQKPHIVQDDAGRLRFDRQAQKLLASAATMEVVWASANKSELKKAMSEITAQRKYWRNQIENCRLAGEIAADEIRPLKEKRMRGEKLSDEDMQKWTTYLTQGERLW